MDEAASTFSELESTPAATTDRDELLVRLLLRHQDDLLRYIFCLLPNREDAKDALQETSIAIYRKFAAYDDNKPFLAWAFGFAYLEVLKQRERKSRENRIFNDELLGLLARERATRQESLDARLQMLDACLKELPAADRELIQHRYVLNCSIEALLTRFKTSRRTLFRNLDRIRRTLFACINRKVQTA
ncbi:MAG TPA: sigma-70 family RNA polymerase sigma factor [Pirellulaceae bacterium]|jgi:RNA polymerase sigma-70 factor (ECF subfamily)